MSFSDKESALEYIRNRGIDVTQAGDISRMMRVDSVKEGFFGYLNRCINLFLATMVPDGEPLPDRKYIENYAYVKAFQYVREDILNIIEAYKILEYGVEDEEADNL